MSNKQAKQERSIAKDLRQMPADDLPSSKGRKKKVDKPWLVLEKASDETIANWQGNLPTWFKEWTRRGAYETVEAAEKAVAHFKTQGYSLKYIYRVVHRDER